MPWRPRRGGGPGRGPAHPAAWLLTTARRRVVDRVRAEAVALRKAPLLVVDAEGTGQGAASVPTPAASWTTTAPPRPDVHPPDARAGGGQRPRAPPRRRGADRGHRPPLPRARADHGRPAHPGQAQDRGRRHPVRRARAPVLPERLGVVAQVGLPRVHRRLRTGQRARPAARRPLGRGRAARAGDARAAPGRAGAARPCSRSCCSSTRGATPGSGRTASLVCCPTRTGPAGTTTRSRRRSRLLHRLLPRPMTTLTESYRLQALVAAEHATAVTASDTRWDRICDLYAALVEALAVTGGAARRGGGTRRAATARRPASYALDGLDDALPRSHRVPAVRGELLGRASGRMPRRSTRSTSRSRAATTRSSGRTSSGAATSPPPGRADEVGSSPTDEAATQTLGGPRSVVVAPSRIGRPASGTSAREREAEQRLRRRPWPGPPPVHALGRRRCPRGHEPQSAARDDRHEHREPCRRRGSRPAAGVSKRPSRATSPRVTSPRTSHHTGRVAHQAADSGLTPSPGHP